MTDNSRNGLMYGHFEDCIYDTDEKEWVWNRGLNAAFTLEPIGSHQISVNSPNHQSGHEPHVKLLSLRAVEHAKQFDTAIVPATDLIAPYTRVSAAVETITSRHDATTGKMLAVVKIVDELSMRRIAVAMYPGNYSRRLLRFVRMSVQKQGWESNKTIWLEVPQVHGESGCWDFGSPVQQLCVSNGLDNERGHVAVRTLSATFILRPVLRQKLVPNPWTSEVSRLDVNIQGAIPVDFTNGVAHADVAFNPWYQKQFAIVNQQGLWWIWELGATRGEEYRELPVIVCQGSIGQSDSHQETGPCYDGWARVAWAGDPATVVLCNRKSMAIYSIAGKPVRMQDSGLGIEKSSDWILDMQRSSNQSGHVFVLTSSFLFCISVWASADNNQPAKSTRPAKVHAKIRHFRDSTDTTLSLDIIQDSEQDVVLIKSACVNLVTTHRVLSKDLSQGTNVALGDAAMIQSPVLPSPLSCVQLQPIEIAESLHRQHVDGVSGPGQGYQRQGIRFWLSTSLLRDFSIVQQLHIDVSSARGLGRGVVAPQWRSRVYQSVPRFDHSSFVLDHKGDEEEADGKDASATPMTYLKISSSGSDWSVNYELAYRELTTIRKEDSQDLPAIIRLVRSRMAENDNQATPCMELLSSFTKLHIQVPDLEEASSTINHLLSSSRDGHYRDQDPFRALLEISEVTNPLSIGFRQPHQHELSIAILYDMIVSRWLAPLGQTVPGRVRLAKEQLARRVAADLLFASHALKQHAMVIEEQDTQTSVDQGPSATISSGQPPGSLPTPTPSLASSMVSGSASSHPSTLIPHELARLSRYTTFVETTAAPSALPRSLSNILKHWKVGSDPANYDWQATQQRLETNFDDQGLTDKQRARLKRRTERHLERQRRETAVAQSQGFMSSQAPQVLSASQPISLPERNYVGASQPLVVPSSSQAPQSQSQAFPASQVEPGRFGGRGPPKKKRRTMGF